MIARYLSPVWSSWDSNDSWSGLYWLLLQTHTHNNSFGKASSQTCLKEADLPRAVAPNPQAPDRYRAVDQVVPGRTKNNESGLSFILKNDRSLLVTSPLLECYNFTHKLAKWVRNRDLWKDSLRKEKRGPMKREKNRLQLQKRRTLLTDSTSSPTWNMDLSPQVMPTHRARST